MGPIQMLQIYRRANKVAGYFQEAAVSKSLFTSKIFWLNVLSAAAELTGVLNGVLPAHALGIATTIINIGLRLVTDQPVHVLPQPSK